MTIGEFVAANATYFALPGLVVGGFLLYAFLLLAFGGPEGRREALSVAWSALATSALAVAAVASLVLVNHVIVAAFGWKGTVQVGAGENVTLYFTFDRAYETLESAAWVFGKAKNVTATWLYVRAYAVLWLSVTPFLGGAISDALGDATSWAHSMLEVSCATYAGLEAATRVLIVLHPWLLALGLACFLSPRLYHLGGALLAAYVAFGAAASYSAYRTLHYLAEVKLDAPGLSDVFPFLNGVDYLIETPDPSDIGGELGITNEKLLSVYGALGAMALLLYRPVVEALVCVSIASAGAWAGATALGAIAPHFLRWGL